MKIKKRFLSLALTLIMVLSLLTVSLPPARADSVFAGGSGTLADPFQIATAEQLNNVRYYLDRHFVLISDITLTENWVPIGLSSSKFTGSFDGNWFTIKNLFVNQYDTYCGLFGYIEGAEIRNLHLQNVSVTTLYQYGSWIGGLAGYVGGGSVIENCKISGTVSGPSQCSAGGLAGTVYGESSISQCDVAVNTSSSSGAGGICSGLSGNSTITNSRASGNVSGYWAGGIAGIIEGGSIEYCYATGLVTESGNGGGIVGMINISGQVLGSYYDKDTTMKEDTSKGTPKSTTEMQTDTPFPDWDTDIWHFASGAYPALYYQSDNHSVTYYGNGAEGSAPVDLNTYGGFDSVTIASPDGLTPPEGKVFKEWNTAPDGTGRVCSAGVIIGMPPENLNLYAIWAAVYSVTYNINGGTGDAPATDFKYGGQSFQPVSPGAVTPPDGLMFRYWNSKADGSGTIYRAGEQAVMPDSDLTLYAVWEPQYTVTYSLNGVAGDAPGGSVLFENDVFEVAEYVGAVPGDMEFIEWNTAADGSGMSYYPGEEITMPAAHLTLYAVWEHLYTVTYYLNDGTDDVLWDGYYYYEGDYYVVAPADGFTWPDGKQFKEWNTAADGSGTAYYPEDEVTIPAADLTLYAIWEPLYTVTYVLNGGTGGDAPEDNIEYYSGDDILVYELPSEITGPDGKVFTRWNTAADGSGTSYIPGWSYTITSSLTLYAVWEPYQDGSAEAPYLVDDYSELLFIGDEPGAYYRQTADIVLPDPSDTGLSYYFPEGFNFIPVGYGYVPFTGSYDGGGHTISNLVMRDEYGYFQYLGLFSYVGEDALIENISLTDVYIFSEYSDVDPAFIGALAGYNAGTIRNCTVSGLVAGSEGSYIGGIAGLNEGAVENCVDNVFMPKTKTLAFDADEGVLYIGYPYEGGTEAQDLPGWSYDGENRVLTLNNLSWLTVAPYALEILSSSETGLTIELAAGSENSFISYSTDFNSCGIMANIDINILGTGTLTVQGGYGLDASAGLFTLYNLTVTGGTVNATGGNAGSKDEPGWSCGILSYGSMTVSGGTVTAKSGHVSENGWASGISISDLTVSGGTAAVAGDTTGIHAFGGVLISGGTVTAAGNEQAIYSYEEVSVTADAYSYWTNTEAGAEGAAGPFSGSAIPFDNGADIYKYVKIIVAAPGGISVGGNPETQAPDGSFEIPVNFLTGPDYNGTMTFTGDLCTITVPSNILGTTDTENKKVKIEVGSGDKSLLPDDIRAAIGDRPLISIGMTINGRPTEWSNPNAPVTISIPYTPTAEELSNPESIVIWYIDGSGNAIAVPSGRYDAATGTVTFSVTHFSDYAVVFSPVSFNDVDKDAWYYREVSYLAAREITNGTGGGNFSPDAKLLRGEFIVLLMRAFGISPDANPSENFADAGNTYYTGYLAAAKRLGLTSGTGGNRYEPEREITRQEMFTLMYNALKWLNKMPQGSLSGSMEDFPDAGLVASWAKEAVSLFVKAGIVNGKDGLLDPTGTATRAEMARLLYKLAF